MYPGTFWLLILKLSEKNWTFFDNIMSRDSDPFWEKGSFKWHSMHTQSKLVSTSQLWKSSKQPSFNSLPLALSKYFFSRVLERSQELLGFASIFISNLGMLWSPTFMKRCQAQEHQQWSALFSNIHNSLLPFTPIPSKIHWVRFPTKVKELK